MIFFIVAIFTYVNFPKTCQRRGKKPKKGKQPSLATFAALAKPNNLLLFYAAEKSDPGYHGWMGTWESSCQRCNSACQCAVCNLLILKVSQYYFGDLRRGGRIARWANG